MADQNQKMIVNGQTVTPPLPEPPINEKSDPGKTTFIIKHLLLWAIISFCLYVGYFIIFIGLLPVSLVLALLVLLLVKEDYKMIASRLSERPQTTAFVLILVSLFL